MRKTRKQREKQLNPQKSKRVWKVVLIALSALLVVALSVSAAAIWFVHDKINRMDHETEQIDKNELEISENKNLTGYRNIALFGVDSRSGTLGKGNRSDCIIIASVNNKTHDVKLISVYRDTYVKIDGHGYNKINAAYSKGGAQLALKTLNANLDLNISEFVTVNFDVLSDAIDLLGGIDMKITNAELQYINSYIDDTNKWTGKKSKHIKKAGTHHLDGVQAVAYCRIRYTSGGDYKRTERMRDVIEAMVAVLKTKGLAEINSFANEILPEVYTNLSTTDILSLLPALASFNISESIGWPYKIKGSTFNGTWYGIPVTLKSNVAQLHQKVFDAGEDYVVPDSIIKVSDKIAQKSGYRN